MFYSRHGYKRSVNVTTALLADYAHYRWHCDVGVITDYCWPETCFGRAQGPASPVVVQLRLLRQSVTDRGLTFADRINQPRPLLTITNQ